MFSFPFEAQNYFGSATPTVFAIVMVVVKSRYLRQMAAHYSKPTTHITASIFNLLQLTTKEKTHCNVVCWDFI